MFRQLSPIVSKFLILIVGIFILQYLFNIDFLSRLGLYCVLSKKFAAYQLITHILVHASFIHLLSNVLAFASFGSVLEQTFGSKNFCIFLIFSGLGAAVLTSIVQYADVSKLSMLYNDYIVHPTPASFEVYLCKFPSRVHEAYYQFSRAFFNNPDDYDFLEKSKLVVQNLFVAKADIPTIGSSGVVFGMLMAFAMLFPNAELMLLFFPIPIKAKYFVAIYALYELYASVNSFSYDNIAHFAHLGGALFGYIFMVFWKRRREE